MLRELKRQALKEGVSLAQMMNRVMRLGLRALASRPKKRFRQRTHDMGEALMPLDKALSIAAALDDEEIIRKLRQGK